VKEKKNLEGVGFNKLACVGLEEPNVYTQKDTV
jgi:hypothetical protein